MLHSNAVEKKNCVVCPSIHPCKHTFPSCLTKVGQQWQQAKKGVPDITLASNIFQVLLGFPEAFPGQIRYTIPATKSGSTSGSLPSHLTKKDIFLQLISAISFFQSLPKAHDHRRGSKVDRLVNRKALPSGSAHSSVQCHNYCCRCTNLPVHLLPVHLPLTSEEDPETLELLHFGQQLPPARSEQSTVRDPWPRTWRFGFSSQPLHTHSLMNSKESHHLQRAGIKF